MKNDSTLAQEGIIKFLKEKKDGNFVIKTMDWKGPIRFRARAVAALFDGAFSLSEFPRLILPTARRPRELDLRYAHYVNGQAEKSVAPFIRQDGSVDVFGHPFFAPFGNYYEMADLLDQIIAFDQYHTATFLKKDAIVIDAGANIGTFSVLAAHTAPQGHIYSFEPAKGTFEILQKNTSPYNNVTCTQSGLGDVPSEKEILVHENTTGGNVLLDSAYAPKNVLPEDAHVEKTSVTTIDAFVAAHNIPRVDFIKIDTEGYEAKILQGAKNTIAKWKPVVAMSAYHYVNDKKDLPQLLKSICPDYICDLHSDYEEDFVCYVKA